jgi:hypothetical protein
MQTSLGVGVLDAVGAVARGEQGRCRANRGGRGRAGFSGGVAETLQFERDSASSGHLDGRSTCWQTRPYCRGFRVIPPFRRDVVIIPGI